MSLRSRLLLGLLVSLTIGVAIVDVLTYALVSRSQLDQVDQSLERAHPPIERAAAGPATDLERAIRDAAPGFLVELRAQDGTGEFVIEIQLPGEEPAELTGPIPSPGGGMTDDEAVFATVTSSDDHPVRVRVSRQADGEVLVIGLSLESYEETLDRLLLVLLLASGGALTVAGIAGWILVRVGLRPLVAVERAARGIDDTDVERRVPGEDERTEVGRLAVAINRMLSRLHRASDDRNADLTALQESEARMRRFVADASHELRTPIAATAAYAELFERGARDHPEDLDRAMSGIRSETSRMGSLVDDLLLLAQLDEGRPIERRPVDVTDVVLEAADAAQVVAPDRTISVRIDAAPVITGDASRLRQVIDNLIGNVRTHTPRGTHCDIVVARVDDRAVVTIADDGPGMSPADAHRSFDRFHRADASRTRASGGSGLGLAIVRAIVTAHDGTVSMTSDHGAGTTVTIELPCARIPGDTP